MTNKKHQMYAKIMLVLSFMVIIGDSKAQSMPAIFETYPFAVANSQHTLLALLYPDAVIIVDIETGEELNRLTGFTDILYAPLSWSNSGTKIAFNKKNSVEIWEDVEYSDQVQQIGVIQLTNAFNLSEEIAPFTAQNIIWYENDTRILLSSFSRISIWDISQKEIISRYVASEWSVNPYSQSAQWISGDLFLFGDLEGQVRLFDVVQKQQVYEAYLPLTYYSTSVTTIALSNNKTRVAIAGSRTFSEGTVIPGKIFIWDLANNAEFYVPLNQAIHPGHGEELTTALSWSPDDRLIASLGENYRLNIWDAVTGEIYIDVPVPQDTSLFSVIWDSSGDEVIYTRATGELVYVETPDLIDLPSTPVPTDTPDPSPTTTLTQSDKSTTVTESGATDTYTLALGT